MATNEIRASIVADPRIRALLPATGSGVTQTHIDSVAAALSVGRFRLVKTEIGPGTILATLGQTGADLLDALEVMAQNPAHNLIKHALKVINAGSFDMGSQASRAQVVGLCAAGLFSVEARDALLALGQAPDPVDEYSVRCAIFALDGSLTV
jgi:hypothetical protein